MEVDESTIKRFMAQVYPDPMSGCWLREDGHMTETMYRDQAPEVPEKDLDCYFVVVLFKRVSESNQAWHWDYVLGRDRLNAYTKLLVKLKITEGEVIRFSVTSVDFILENKAKMKQQQVEFWTDTQ